MEKLKFCETDKISYLSSSREWELKVTQAKKYFLNS
jgi:hypothetical protein